MTPTSALVILMIDDNPFFARHVERMCAPLVAGEGGAWAWARTPAEGLEQAGRLHPSVVLLDPTLHEAGEPWLEDYCRTLVQTAAPATPALLFLTNPVHPLDEVLSRLAVNERLTVGALSKPFEPEALIEKVSALLLLASNLTPTTLPMSDPALPASPFAWLVAAPEVSGYAHLDAAGAVLEWSGDAKDQGPHGALVYLQRLANLCGEELGLGPVAEVDAVGPAGCGLSIQLNDGGSLNVLASPRANLRAIAARTAGVGA